MSWFKVDDTFYRSRKVRKLGVDRVACVGLWTLCGNWSADNLTDGFVPWEVVEDWDPTRTWAARLIEVGLWREATVDGEHGIQFHDWTDYQPTKAEVERRREDARERMRRLRGGSVSEQEVEQGEEPDEKFDDSSDAVRANSAHEGKERSPHVHDPVPSRPVVPDGTSRPRKRGTRIPDDFTVTPEMVVWARSRCPDVNGRRETEKFINYWTSTPGAKGLKLDWKKTWMNWMLSADERLPRHLRSVPASTSDSPWATPKSRYA